MRNYPQSMALVACLLMALPWSSLAEDARSLPVGAAISDGALRIGARTWTLPPGDWKLAGRHLREVRLNEVRGGTEVIEAFPALIREGRLDAGLIMTGPTGGSSVRAWREDPSCRVDKVLLKEDNSTATLSDCLIIRVATSLPAQVAGAEVYASAAQWMQAEGIKTPRPLLQVLIVKYVDSEYFRSSCWFDPAVFGLKAGEISALTTAPEPVVQWAKAYRATISAALGTTSGTFQVPPLPAR